MHDGPWKKIQNKKKIGQWRTKHEARSTKHEAWSMKHEARSMKHEARSMKHDGENLQITNPRYINPSLLALNHS